MDVHLSSEAYKHLLGLEAISFKPDMDGLLLGHKRAQRFFVERILPTVKGFYSSLENYQEADRHFKGKLLGFFSFDSNEKKLVRILQPFAFGQLFLALHSNERKKLTIKSYIIDFKKNFYLSPIDLKLPKTGK